MKSFTQSLTIFLFLISLQLLMGGCANSQNNTAKSSSTESESNRAPIPWNQVFERADRQAIVSVNDQIVPQGTALLIRIKSKYIENIQIPAPNGPNATNNGLIKVTVSDREKALSDLLSVKEAKRMLNGPSPKQTKHNSKTPYELTKVDTPPQIIGGMQAINNELQYPAKAQKAKTEGVVYIEFVVDSQGKPQNIKIVRGIGNGCDQEAKRVVNSLNFEPGVIDGKPVPVNMKLPIRFALD